MPFLDEAMLAAIMESGDAAIHAIRPDGVITSWTPMAERLYGWTAAEANGASVSLIVPPDRREELADLLERLQHRESAMQVETVRMHKDGTRIPATATFSAIVDERGVVVGAAVITRAIDAGRRAEVTLRERLYLHEQAQSLAHVGTWVWDVDESGRTTWSKEMYRIFGVEEGTPVRVHQHLATVDADDARRIEAVRAAALERDEPFDIEYRIRRADGELRWIHSRATVVRDRDGTPLRLLGVARDTTEQKRALEELGASEQRYRRILETTTLGVWTVDAGGKTTFVNGRLAEMLGCTPGEFRAIPCLDAVAPQLVERSLRRRTGASDQVELELRRKDGSIVDALVEITPILGPDGRHEGAVAMVLDVTARKAAERSLRESEERIRLLLDSTGEALYGMDLDGKCEFANAACVRLLGYQNERDLLGRDMRNIVEQIGHCVLRRTDGSSFDADVRCFPMLHDGVRVGSVVSFVDITDQRRAEEALRRVQKMEAIGQLAGGIAHDFNNIISVVLTYTSFLLDAFPQESPMREDVEQVRAAGERAAELTRQLLAFGRRQVLKPTALEIDSVFAGMERMLRRLLGADITLSFAAEHAPWVRADRGQLEQVLMNLAVNARDAMPDGGKLSISASVVELGAERAARLDGIAPGPYVLVTVSDTGCGIEPEIRDRIFEPFFTTKGPKKGTGLGLATVFGIVKQSGGAISVTSEPGVGTKFEIFLPRSEAAKEASVTAVSPDAARGSETILLVEDDEQVRALTRAVLRRHGYDVIDVPNAGEALLVCEQHGGSIDLLLTDVVLPRMSGRQLVERLAPSRPGMRVLYVSGCPDDEAHCRGVNANGVAFLHKPLTPGSIVSKVREVLDLARSRNSDGLAWRETGA